VPDHERLTPRESEVLTYLSKGFTIKEIASLMGIKWFTVNDHIKSIYKKLNVSSRAEAAVLASQAGPGLTASHAPAIDARWTADAQRAPGAAGQPHSWLCSAHGSGQAVVALATRGRRQRGLWTRCCCTIHLALAGGRRRARARQLAQHQQRWRGALATGSGDPCTWPMAACSQTCPAATRGYAGVGLAGSGPWPGLALVAVCCWAPVVMLARPQIRNALYLVMALCQSANLLFMALETCTRTWVCPPGIDLANWAWTLRLALDAVHRAAAIAHAVARCTRAACRMADGVGRRRAGLLHACWAWACWRRCSPATCLVVGARPVPGPGHSWRWPWCSQSCQRGAQPLCPGHAPLCVPWRWPRWCW
jgi:DNA-binding CsgD family transcriptional regulator